MSIRLSQAMSSVTCISSAKGARGQRATNKRQADRVRADSVRSAETLAKQANYTAVRRVYNNTLITLFKG